MKLSFRLKHFKDAEKKYDFIVASNKGSYLGLKDLDAETYYDVKFTRESGLQMPTEEGLYFVECEDTLVWLDKRETTKRPTIRINDSKAVVKKWVAKK